MARDNKTIGKFKLKGIKPAPGAGPGSPQIEVTFDIDANGILKVSAKDLDTGKQQSITITADDRMSEAEIEQAIRDARNYAGQDEIRVKAVDLLGEAQRLLNQSDQEVNARGKQLDKSLKKQIKSDTTHLRKLVAKCRLEKVDEAQMSEIRAAKEQLERTLSLL